MTDCSFDHMSPCKRCGATVYARFAERRVKEKSPSNALSHRSVPAEATLRQKSAPLSGRPWTLAFKLGFKEAANGLGGFCKLLPWNELC